VPELRQDVVANDLTPDMSDMARGEPYSPRGKNLKVVLLVGGFSHLEKY